MVNKNTSFRHIYMLFFYLLVNYHYYYSVSLDAVDIVKLGICVAVGKPILNVQPVSVGPASRD